jgi:hypothetical protein
MPFCRKTHSRPERRQKNKAKLPSSAAQHKKYCFTKRASLAGSAPSETRLAARVSVRFNISCSEHECMRLGASFPCTRIHALTRTLQFTHLHARTIAGSHAASLLSLPLSVLPFFF